MSRHAGLEADTGDDRGGAIGACTWLFGDHDHPRIAERAARLGLDGVEILPDIARGTPRLVGGPYTDAGLQVLSLTPDNVDIAHPDGAARRRALDYYRRLIEFAARLDCAHVTCHERTGQARPADGASAEWDRLVGSCRQLAEVAADHAVTLVFEPLRRGLVSQVHNADDVCRLVDEVGHPALSVVLDTYHLCLEETDPPAAIRRCGRRVTIVQLGDTDRRPLGTGTAPLDRCLEALAGSGFAGPWILECTSQLLAPSLVPRAVDPEQVDRELGASVRWLRARLTGLRRPHPTTAAELANAQRRDAHEYDQS